MISVRLAVPAVLVAALLAGYFTYFVLPATPEHQLPEKMPGLAVSIPAIIDRPRAEGRADEFLQAAQAILKKDPNAQASAEKPTGHIPLPKRRPILRNSCRRKLKIGERSIA